MKRKRSLREWLRLHDQVGIMGLIGIPVFLLLGVLTRSEIVTAGVAFLWVIFWGCMMSAFWEKLRCPHCGCFLFKHMNFIKTAGIKSGKVSEWSCQWCNRHVDLDAPIDTTAG